MRSKLYFLIILIGAVLVSIHSTPSAIPSAIPSVVTTDYPTVIPSTSKVPSETPSLSPTTNPSTEPSTAPSFASTLKPSNAPSIEPSWQPTITPSFAPNSSPTIEPSVSMNPTSFPTGRNVARYIQCDNLVCEGESDGDCTYNSGTVILECADEFTPCEITTGAFTVGPNTQLLVSGGCELVVEASTTALIHTNTTIEGTGISISSHGDIVVQGVIRTDGQGPLLGPGSPTDLSHLGYGGTYGGSGGQAGCGSAYFTNTANQIGSINVLDDITLGDVGYNSTYGSGGGFTGGGHGGGRIVLKTAANVVVHPTGIISADGSAASDLSIGAGSGGSITISAFECVQKGVISALGGSTYSTSFDTGAAGGGGRVAIIMSSLNSTWSTFNAQSTNIFVTGGYSTDSCKTGASGTVYIQLGHGGIHSFNAGLWIANSGQSSFAVTTLDSIPTLTNILSISEYAVATCTQSLHLLPLPSCSINTINIRTLYKSDCSIIDINNASFVVLSNNTESVLHSEGTEWAISADSIRLVDSHLFGSLNTFYSFNITSRTFFLSETSSIKYSGRLHLRMKEVSVFHGDLLQVEGRIAATPELAYYHHSFINIYTGNNVFISNLIANNLMISANTVNFTVGKGANSPPGYIPQACQVGVKLGQFTCSRNVYTGTLRYNNTYVIAATEWIDVAHRYSLVAAQVLLCAPDVNIHSGAEVSANQRGCVAAHGVGAGGAQSSTTITSPYGAGGAGYGGMGGAGYNTDNGGTVYAVTGELSSGSGGGCLACNRTYYGAGGGIINIVANNSMFLNGNLTSNGGYGSTDAGGGSGGTVSINALTMKGMGHISVSGGSGGSGKFPGGGGGGGMLTIFNDVKYYLSYNYVGIVSASGGQPGHPLLTFDDDNTSTSTSATTTRIPSRLLRTPVLYSTDDDEPSPAMRGQDGVLNLPQCPAGYGNGESSGTVCGLCPAGTYAPGDGKNDCYYCKNKPTHAHYTTEGWTTSDCPYDCNAGYSTSDCYTPFQNFIFHTLGLIGIIFCSVGFLGLILLPLVYYRYKKEYGWFEETSKKSKITLPTDTFTHVDDYRVNDKHRSGGRKSSIDKHITETESSIVDNPLRESDSSEPVDYPRGLSNASSAWEGRTMSTGSALPSAFKKMDMDLRLRLRLVDPDLVTHACRVNLLGSNHPNPAHGGPWHMPICRPACLRPMLRKAEYRQLAERVNRRVAWQSLGWEMMLFHVTAFLVPPLAAFLMRQFRKRHGDMLLKLIATYDYSCFRCPHQRASKNSLRIGISPDATLAYIDFLFDEDVSSTRMKPLCPVGQVRLPASFKVAGLGTYFSPYYIDTNDLILQAVPQTDIPSSFINTTWISFVVELNTILRTVQKDSLYFGIRRLIRFLSEKQHAVDLGGLVVEFCTFPNTETIYTSEASDISIPDVLVQSVNATTAEQLSKASTAGTLERRNTSWERWIMKQRFSEQPVSNSHTISSIPSPKVDRNSSINSNSGGIAQQSVDVAFTSPHVSQDYRESMIETSTKQVVSCCSWVMETLRYYMKLLALYVSYCDFQEPILTDPNGSDLSFIDMCDAIHRGQLKLGIVVTHPKVVASNYIVQDEDYESEEESFYNRGGDSGDETYSVDSASLQSLPQVLAATADAWDSTTDGTATKQRYSSALRRTYGDKAEEVAKFYNIMVAADSNMAAANRGVLPYSASTSLAGSPVGQSTLAGMVSAVKNPLLATTAPIPAALPSTPVRAARGIAATPEHCSSTTATAGEAAFTQQQPPAEYTDLSPFRAMRRASRTNDRDSMILHPRTTDMSAVDDRLTDEDIMRFQSFKDIAAAAQNEEKLDDDDEADSRDSSSINEVQEYDESELHLPSDDSPESNYHARKQHICTKRGSALLNRNAPIKLDRKSIASLRHKRRFSKRKCRDLSTENLAPSAFQHSINCWRLNEEQEFISDGIIRILLSASYQNDFNYGSYRSDIDHSSVDHSSSGCSVDVDDRVRNISTVARTGHRHLLAPNTSFSLTPTAKSRSSLSRGKQMSASPWYDIRSFLGATSTSKARLNTSSNSISFSEEKSASYNVDNKEIYSEGSSDAGSVVNHDDSSNTERSGRVTKDIENPEINLNTTTNTASLVANQLVRRNSRRSPIVSNYKPFYFLRLLLFYVRNFMLGSNVYPIGPAYVRKILELLIFTMCIVDIALSIIVLTSAYCASSDATACTDHTSMILMVAVWPGALLIAPVMGLTTVVLGPSGTLARIYALWSRIAGINSAMVVWSMVYYFDYYYNVPGSIYFMLLLPGSRVFQCLFVDLYIAHIERLRYTRGWDGLHTSLFKTQDNLQDVISD